MDTVGKKTLGQAIDAIVDALTPLDKPSRATAIRAACEHLGIDQAATAGTAQAPVPEPTYGGTTAEIRPATAPQPIQDIRSLKEQKQPKTAAEMACLVAYYLDSLAAPAERKQEVTAGDIEKYFKQGGYPLPKRLPQLLVDARASGYFDTAGHGKYRLNPVGHNLVVHSLPRSQKK